jgi:hypothetical protein
VTVDGVEETRTVTLDPTEITTLPREPDQKNASVVTGGVDEKVDVSSEVALVLLGLLALELGLRAAHRLRPKRARRKGDVAPAGG